MSTVDAESSKVVDQNRFSVAPQAAAAPKVRRAAVVTQDVPSRKRPSTAVVIGLVLASLVIGIAAGVQAMRLRHQAREALVSINGVVVNKDELFPRLERAAGRQVMTQILQEELQLQFAKSKGVVATPAQVEARYREFENQPGFKETALKRGLWPEDVRQQLRLAIVKEAILSKGITATDAEVNDFYRKNTDPKNKQALYYTPETITMSVIVTPTEAEARRALADLDTGIPFATVAQNRSRDPSRVAGGYLNPVLRGRTEMSRVPGMEEAVFRLKVGERLGPRRFKNAWWIIDCVDKTGAVKKNFESVKEECRRQVLTTKGMAVRRSQIDHEFKTYAAKADLKAFYSFYEPVIQKPE